MSSCAKFHTAWKRTCIPGEKWRSTGSFLVELHVVLYTCMILPSGLLGETDSLALVTVAVRCGCITYKTGYGVGWIREGTLDEGGIEMLPCVYGTSRILPSM
jgi:hypothetical protein